MTRRSALALLAFVAACGSNDTSTIVPAKDQVTISVFKAAPDTVEVGDSTKLIFAVVPTSAKLTITNVGDVTGKTEMIVTPTATTTYQLRATNGSASATSDAMVSVGPKKTVGLKIALATGTPTAGDEDVVTLTALDANGN